MSKPISEFLEKYYKHFNAAALVDAAQGYKEQLQKGNKMLVTLAGAMSTAELGKIFAEMIRQDKVQIISCTGANLEEDLFNLVAHEYKSHVIYSELLKALDHPAVQPVIGRVSDRRMEYLTASFRQAGLGRTDAQHRARLAYAAYIGFLQLNLQLHQARLQHDEFEAYVEHVMVTLIPSQ